MKYEIGEHLFFQNDKTGEKHRLTVVSQTYSPSEGECTSRAIGNGIELILKNELGENAHSNNSNRFDWVNLDYGPNKSELVCIPKLMGNAKAAQWWPSPLNRREKVTRWIGEHPKTFYIACAVLGVVIFATAYPLLLKG